MQLRAICSDTLITLLWVQVGSNHRRLACKAHRVMAGRRLP